jgi:hypothetical protein
MCPTDAKISAGYKNKAGEPRKLCSVHAREQGTHEVQNPCEMCPTDAKISAGYKNKAGDSQKLCALHAVREGTLAKHHPSASRVACEFMDRWSREIGHGIDHIHLRPGQEPEGREDVIQGTRYRPDGRDEKNPMVLYEYLGNPYHGYPLGHPEFYTLSHIGKTHDMLYEETMQRFQVIADMGYTIFYVWGHDYQTTTRARCPSSLKEVVKQFQRTLRQ